MTCKKAKTRKCKPSASNFKTLEDIVADYIDKIRQAAKEELRFYAEELPSFKEVVKQAALAKGSWDGVHDHQKKYGVADKLPAFAKSLLEALPELENVDNFRKLHDAVKAGAGKVFHNAKLTFYDTALRIGAYRKIEPKEVYLHCGAEVGARALGIKIKGRRAIPVGEFDSAFHQLKPREIEDLLCIYKENLEKIGRA